MINGKVVVYFRAPFMTLSGYGVHARQILDYLLSDDRFIVCADSINWGNCSFIHNHKDMQKYYQTIARFEEMKAKKIEPDISVQVTIPNEFQKIAKVNIGVTAGIEVDRTTLDWIKKCNEMDMLIVPSEFSKNVLTKTVAEWKNKNTGETGELKIEKPIFVIPEWFERPEEIKKTSVSNLKFDTTTNFLHVGQWGNKGNFGEDRKNIADMLRYFFTFFKDCDDVGLVLKVNTINNSEQDREVTIDKIKQIKSNFQDVKCKVHLLHDTLNDEQMWELYKHPQLDAFISLTHGEGYGLPLLEAAAAGLPVIATNWSGHLQFLRKKHGFIPLKYEMVDIPECQVWPGVIDKGSKWAKVEEKDLKRVWHKFVNSKKFPKDKAVENVKWLDENFSKKALMKVWREFFDERLFGKVKKPDGTVEQITKESHYLNSLKNNAKQAIQHFGIQESDRKKVLFVMPRSAGDVLLCTAVVDSLIKNRHYDDEHDFYFATQEQFKDLVIHLEEEYKNFKVIDYNENMMNSELMSEVFDYFYNPGINVQYTFSNWRLGNGEYAVKLFAEFAKNCNIHPGEITNYKPPIKECTLPEKKYIVFSPAGQKSAKDYNKWNDVIYNLKKSLPDLEIVQTGFDTEKLYKGVIDYRGRSYPETFYLIKNAVLAIGVDSFPAHAAAAVETPYITLYGSTDTTVSPTVLGKKTLGLLIETTDRHGCKNPCFKDECFNPKNGQNCISNIDASAVVQAVHTVLEKINKENETKEIDISVKENWKFEEVFPSISAYTTVYNCFEGGYPLEKSIESFMWADECVVVDGGSTDGTREKLEELKEKYGERLQVYDMPIDWENPGKDGAQKGLSRAMCTSEFCLQFDIDEVCGKDSGIKFQRLAKTMPENVNMYSLPIFEFWGPEENHNLRTDRHIWKWRLSRNVPEITHGIPKADRIELDGKIYSKGGSDGCFPIHVVSEDMIPNHFPNNWFNEALENARLNDIEKYKEMVKEIFDTLPYVKHYSWTDIETKLKMLRGPWNKLWCELFNKDPESPDSNDYFDVAWPKVTDDMIKDKAKEMLQQGGQRPAPLVNLRVE